MAKIPMRQKTKKKGEHGGSATKPGTLKVQPKKSFKKKRIKQNQNPPVSSMKSNNKATSPKVSRDQSGTPKPKKRSHRGGRGRGGRRVKKKVGPVATSKSIILKEGYKSAKEKDQKLMKKFTKVQSAPMVKDTKIDPKQLINLDMLRAAISGLRKLPSARKSERKSLHDITDEDERLVYLQVTLCKLRKVTEDLHLAGPTTVNVYLPNPLVTDNTDVILITKDLQRGIRRDHQNTLDHFKELLDREGVASLVTEVIPLRQLKVEYKEFEAKRLLANRTDLLLCDDTVIRLIPKFLSKHFYIQRKLPVQVNLKARNLRKEMIRALSVSRLFFSMKGNSAIMQIGRMLQTNEALEANVLEAVRKLASHAPGNWDNIQGLSLKLESTPSIPLYVKMDSLNSVMPLPEKPIFPGEIVSGTLNTQPGRCITVFPDGSITSTRLKKNKKRITKEEEMTITEEVAKQEDKEADSTATKKTKKKKSAASENGIQGKVETGEAESSEVKEKTKQSTKRKATEKKTSKTKKQKKAHDSDSDSDSGDDDLEEQELMYLKQLSQQDEEPAVEEEEAEDSEVDVWGDSESDMDDSD